ncbi:MAG: alpha/beta fold hydrolase [Sphingobacteriales bacterium]|jgi:pimeloyl-[acyl-carrier protein] methyl ester esterase
MRIQISGSGPAVVFIHGWAASGRVMQGMAMDLERKYETHVLDLPGHGDAVTGRTDFTLAELMQPVIDYVGDMAAPPALVGWAMGAMISLKVAATTKVRGAICIGTPSGGPEHGPVFEKLAARMSRDWPRYVRSSVDAIVGDRVSLEMHQFIRAVMQQTPPSLARRTLIEVAKHDPTEWARQIDCPILYVHGAEDKISPVAVSEALAKASPKGILKIYDGIGHAPFLEAYEAFLADMNAFMETIHG